MTKLSWQVRDALLVALVVILLLATGAQAKGPLPPERVTATWEHVALAATDCSFGPGLNRVGSGLTLTLGPGTWYVSSVAWVRAAYPAWGDRAVRLTDAANWSVVRAQGVLYEVPEEVGIGVPLMPVIVQGPVTLELLYITGEEPTYADCVQADQRTGITAILVAPLPD